jgi:hypothetical protein
MPRGPLLPRRAHILPVGSTVRLYRAVSRRELADILAIRRYRIAPGMVEGKYFALTIEDARFFRDELADAMAIVGSMIRAQTRAILEHIDVDGCGVVFASQIALVAVNSDADRFRGIAKLE